MDKKNFIKFLFFFILILGQSFGIQKVFGKGVVSKYASHQSQHANSQLKKCDPPEEEMLLKAHRSSQVFSIARRSIQFAKPVSVVPYKLSIPFKILQYCTGNNNWYLSKISRLIIFPFHDFW